MSRLLDAPEPRPIPAAHHLNPDQLRQAQIDRDPLAKLVHDFIADLPAARRLYPDLYAVDVANGIRAAAANTPNLEETK